MYTGKSKNAQETHEAIRPSGETFRTPGELQGTLRGNDWKLYDLIWKRTVASQMADAKGSTATVTIHAEREGGILVETVATGAVKVAEFSASGTVITFRGFMHAYEESKDEERNESADAVEAKLPQLTENQKLALLEIEAK